MATPSVKPNTSVIVAASNSKRKGAADYRCSGSDDHTKINAAIDSLFSDVSSESVTVGTYLLVDDMDNPVVDGWTGAQGDETLTKEDAIVFRGSSLKVVPGSTDLPGATLSGSWNLSTYSHLDLRMRCAANAKIRVRLSDGSSQTYFWGVLDRADQWQRLRIPFAETDTNSANLSAITEISIHAVIDDPPASHVFYIDEVGFSNSASLANTNVEPGSVVISGKTEGTDFDIEYESGQIFPCLAGTIASGATVSVSYTKGGGECRLLPGDYRIGTTSGDGVVLRSYVTLVVDAGAVLHASGGVNYSGGDSVITTGTEGILCAEITGFGRLQGYRDNWSKSQVVLGILLQNQTRCSVTGSLEIIDFSGPGFAAERTTTARRLGLVVKGLTIKRCAPRWVDEPGRFYNQIAGTTAQKAAFRMEGHNSFVVTDLSVIESLGDATHLNYCDDGIFSDCVFRRPAMGGYFIENCDRIVTNGSLVDGAGSRGVSVEISSTDVVFCGCTVLNSGREAIWINNSSRTNISGCNLLNAGLRGSYGGSTGSGPTSDDVALVRISGTGTGNILQNNLCRAQSGYTEYIFRNESSSSTIVDNVISGTPDVDTLLNTGASLVYRPIELSAVKYSDSEPDLFTGQVAFFRSGTGLRLKTNDGTNSTVRVLSSDIFNGSAPSLSLADDFNRADSVTLGNTSDGKGTWVEIRSGTNFQIISNRAAAAAGVSPIAVVNYELGSVNHYSQVDITSAGTGGCAVGFGGSSPSDGYVFIATNSASDTYRLFKFVSQTLTLLQTVSTTAPGSSFTARLEVDADGNLTGKINGSSVITATDTSVSLGKRVGMYGASNGARYDDFSGADL